MAIVNKFHICLIGVQEEQGENGTSAKFGDIIVENFPGVMKYTHPQNLSEFSVGWIMRNPHWDIHSVTRGNQIPEGRSLKQAERKGQVTIRLSA